jgi:acetoin utilization deacetylase AcuC-like enzyme
MLGYVLDDVFVQHRAPHGHPERPARLEAVRDALLGGGLRERGRHVVARRASDEELARVHRGSFLDELTRKVPGQSGWLDADTYFSPETWNAALAAAGGTSELALRVMSGELTRGLAIVRPPGHHATADHAMGFCLLNNVAIAAAAARAAGAARVAILDWDVHHGNGTQDIFWNDPDVLYLSVHQWPYYPGSGAPAEIGGPSARGATVNVGLPAGSGDAQYLAVFDEVLIPAIRRFKPDLVLVSAGFDAHEDDPLAGMRVTRAGFGAMAARLRTAVDAIAGGRMVVAMEGGYDLGGLAGGMSEVLDVLSADRVSAPPQSSAADPAPVGVVARAAIGATLRALGEVGAAP